MKSDTCISNLCLLDVGSLRKEVCLSIDRPHNVLDLTFIAQCRTIYKGIMKEPDSGVRPMTSSHPTVVLEALTAEIRRQTLAQIGIAWGTNFRFSFACLYSWLYAFHLPIQTTPLNFVVPLARQQLAKG